MMQFTERAFLNKCTQDVINKLNDLGYIDSGSDIVADHFNCIYISEGKYYKMYSTSCPSRGVPVHNCGDNEDLFFAIAYLRKDSDVNQWFVMDVEIYSDINKDDWFLSTDINGHKHIGTQIEPFYCHKATVKEIIQHFKNN